MPLTQPQPFPRNYKLIKTEDEKQRKGLEDIITLKKLLKSRGRNDLAILIEDCNCEVEESSQYGSYTFSTISTFWFYVPPEKIEKLEQISENDKNLLIELVKKIYPPKEHSPEIREINFRVLTNNKKNLKKNNIEKPRISSYKSKENWFSMNNPLVWLLFSCIFVIISYFIYRILIN